MIRDYDHHITIEVGPLVDTGRRKFNGVVTEHYLRRRWRIQYMAGSHEWVLTDYARPDRTAKRTKPLAWDEWFYGLDHGRSLGECWQEAVG